MGCTCCSSSSKCAGLLQGSRSSVVRASTAKVGGLWVRLPVATHAFFLQFVSILIYHHQVLADSVTVNWLCILISSVITVRISLMAGIQSC